LNSGPERSFLRGLTLDLSEPSVAHRAVVEYEPEGNRFADTHERVTRTEIARRLAQILGLAFAGEYDPGTQYPGTLYFVPSDSLSFEQAARLGIKDQHDLFGGVVPFPFVATKLITHPSLTRGGTAPAGWSNSFPCHVRRAVLHGYSVFTQEQALEAGKRLLDHGPVRLKPVHATAGRGQAVLESARELTQALAPIGPRQLAETGLVLEENLTDVTTCSVGQVRVADLVVTYYGHQRLTADNAGEEVYGGSDLEVVRGAFEALDQLSLVESVRVAVEQARTYDAATTLFSGMFASRRNYDVAQGLNARGQWRSGVLEQSWRIGGATAAEIAALERFRADPGLQVVRASTYEIYGASVPPPSNATIYFDGVDERVGHLIKYAVAEVHGDTR
jgi:hypothetical protein